MVAARRKRAHSPAVAIHPSSGESDSDDSVASEERTKVESVKKHKVRLLPMGFLDPLQSPKSKRSSKSSGNKIKLEHDDESGDTKKWFLLKLLEEDYNEQNWRQNGTRTKEAWDKISQAFNERFPNANLTKTYLQDQVYHIKKTYKCLKQLSELDGLKWDYVKNMLQGPEAVWQKLLLTNKDAKKWYNTPWPYYSTCQGLFPEKPVNKKQSNGANENGGVTPLPVKISLKLNSVQELDAVVEIDMSSPQSSFVTLHLPSQSPACTKSSVMTKLTSESKNLKRKSDQCSESRRLLAHDEADFSIKTCMEGFYKLNGFTKADLFNVGRIFRSTENREMFLSLKDEGREFWLRAEIDADK